MPSATRRALLARSSELAALLAAAAGLLPGGAAAAADGALPAAAFDAATVADLLRVLGRGALVESREVSVEVPEIAENGAVVPVTIATTLAGARRLLLVVDRNPAVLTASFELTPAVLPSFALRIKMAQSAKVHAVALTDDGRLLFARKDVTVTIGGCG